MKITKEILDDKSMKERIAILETSLISSTYFIAQNMPEEIFIQVSSLIKEVVVNLQNMISLSIIGDIPNFTIVKEQLETKISHFVVSHIQLVEHNSEIKNKISH